MNGPRLTLILDDNVPIMRLVEAAAAVGLVISNIEGFTFRVHVAPWTPNVIDLRTRRPRALLRTSPPQPGAT